MNVDVDVDVTSQTLVNMDEHRHDIILQNFLKNFSWANWFFIKSSTGIHVDLPERICQLSFRIEPLIHSSENVC